jgi:hypothetical protein
MTQLYILYCYYTKPILTLKIRLNSTQSINNNRALMLAIDNINFAFEADMIRLARAGISKHRKMRQELRSPRYTTVWDEIPIIK